MRMSCIVNMAAMKSCETRNAGWKELIPEFLNRITCRNLQICQEMRIFPPYNKWRKYPPYSKIILGLTKKPSLLKRQRKREEKCLQVNMQLALISALNR